MIATRILSAVAGLSLFLGAVLLAPPAGSQAGASSAILSGTVKGADGKPLEGVGVSARDSSKTYTTTVYTNQAGIYSFPQLEEGQYKIWAQAVGFDAAVKEISLKAGGKQEELILSKLQDFQKQLSGPEWLASLPDTPADRRMKSVLVANCTGCHPTNFVLQNKFDAAGWTAIVNLMERFSSIGYVPEGAKPNPVIQAYKEDLVAYLTRVRGPKSAPLDLKALPRPTGDATRVIVTEFDLSRPDEPSGWIMPHNGSDWSEGTPSRFEGRAAHDVVVDREGMVWFADDATPDRTIGKLDPRTGHVTDYKLATPKNTAETTHAITIGKDGTIWAANETEGAPTGFDSETGKFLVFPRPGSIPSAGGFVATDSKGNAWAGYGDGFVKLDPRTGKFTDYPLVTKGKGTYGLDVDREDNVWIAQPVADRLGVLDRDGKVSEVVLDPLNTEGMGITDKDREISSTVKLGQNNATPLQKGPRRLATDRNGDYVWVSEYFADRLARIDIHTKKVKEYPLPTRYSAPYAIAVDKNHMVWVSLFNADRIEKFDPTTEKFTEYQLPTLGTESRHINVDDRTDPPTVWVPYDRTNKIARIQFITKAASR